MDLQLSDRLVREAAESDLQACVEGEDFFGVLRATPHKYMSCSKLDSLSITWSTRTVHWLSTIAPPTN
jgi:hypothetical protein